MKNTNDLLGVRSDAFTLTQDSRIVLHPSRTEPPVVTLDGSHFKFIDQFEARFPSGPPSLLGCDTLEGFFAGGQETVQFSASIAGLSGAQIDTAAAVIQSRAVPGKRRPALVCRRGPEGNRGAEIHGCRPGLEHRVPRCILDVADLVGITIGGKHDLQAVTADIGLAIGHIRRTGRIEFDDEHAPPERAVQAHLAFVDVLSAHNFRARRKIEQLSGSSLHYLRAKLEPIRVRAIGRAAHITRLTPRVFAGVVVRCIDVGAATSTGPVGHE